MGLQGVFQLLQLVVPAIQTAEEFIRGRNRGQEKSEAVVAKIVKQSADLQEQVNSQQGLLPGVFGWVKYVTDSGFIDRLKKLIAAIVDLANYVDNLEKMKKGQEVIN